MKKYLQKYKADKIYTEPSLYNRGQRYEQSQYTFLRSLSDEEDDEDDGDVAYVLQTRNEEFLEKTLEPGDTLQTLSIQFNCPIAELKRVNNIHRENEVFARRIIKVPIRYYSFLSEKVAGVHKKPDNASVSTSFAMDDASTSRLASSSSLNTLFKTSNKPQDNIDLLLTRDGEFVIQNSDPLEDDECLATSSLVPQNSTTTRETSSTVFECSGSDWGLSWLHLLVCILLFLFGGPILYLLYHRVETTKNSGSTLVNSTYSNHTIL